MSPSDPVATTDSVREHPLLRALIDSLPDYIYIKDAQSRIIISNVAHARALGAASPDQVVGKSDRDCFPEALARQYYDDEQAVMRSGEPLNREEIVQSPGGEIRWLHTTKSPLKDTRGQVIGLVGISRDITARKLAEDRLQQTRHDLERRVAERTEELTRQSADLASANTALATERDLLKGFIENTPDAVYFKDRQSRLVRCSRSLANFFGLADADEALGKTDFDFFTRDHAQPAYDGEQRIIETGVPLVGVVEKETWPDGRVTWALTSKLPWRNEAGEIIGTFGISKNITDLKQAEAEAERANKQIIIASREAGMAEVATGVLHNVGNVLNSVNVSVTLVADRLKASHVSDLARLAGLFDQHSSDIGRYLAEDPKGRQVPAYLSRLAEHLIAERSQLMEELETLKKNVGHIKDIVTMQQSYAKIVGVVDRISLAELVEDAVRIQAAAFQRHRVQLTREFEELPPVMVDKHKVLQILINLLRNAKQACDAAGRDEKQIQLRVRRLGPARVAIEISDNGVGIPPENLTKIFSHGFTTRQGGHGFGLHSSALAAQELGGSLNARSAGANQGATFTLELPTEGVVG